MLKELHGFEGHGGEFHESEQDALASILAQAKWGDVKSAIGKNGDVAIVRLRNAIVRAAAIIKQQP